MAWILGFGCTSAAGPSSAALWQSLTEGAEPSTFLWKERSLSAHTRLVTELEISWDEALAPLDAQERARLHTDSVGVIFASTKGDVDDFIWQNPSDPRLERDALTPVLEAFLTKRKLRAKRRAVVSNACTSALSALFLAERWLTGNKELTDIIVLAADTVGPFVERGFESLRVLTQDKVRPFDAQRSGFHLGEAAATLILSRTPSPYFCRGAGIDAEGFAVTRPAHSGESLKRACLRIPRLVEEAPDLIIAHGTATQVNDQIEDVVYTSLFGVTEQKPVVTGTKWLVGHSLGASGALDLVAAIKVLEKQKTFSLATTRAVDPQFRSRYLLPGKAAPTRLDRVLVSSLGFGGIHAAALLERSLM